MTCFIRKVPTKSGATTVQIVYKRGREVVGIKHIGSAHNKAGFLDILLIRAKAVKSAGQLELDLFGGKRRFIWKALIQAFCGML